MKRGSNILASVFLKRVFIFFILSALLFCSLFYVTHLSYTYYVCVEQQALTNGVAVTQWLLWYLLFYLSLLAHVLFGLWVIADSPTENYFSFTRNVKNVINAIITGMPMGYCLQIILLNERAITLTTATFASLSIVPLLFKPDLEHRMRFTPIPSHAISKVPCCHNDFSISKFTLFVVCSWVVYHYITGIISIKLSLCLFFVPCIVLVLKVTLESLFGNLVLHPVDFDKLKPSSLYEGLGFDGILYSDLVKSGEGGPLQPPNFQSVMSAQVQYLDNLYRATVARIESVEGPLHLPNTLLFFGIPRPATSAHSSSSNVFVHSRPSLFSALCRSVALRDLCRIARVSPLRRALIYRNQLLTNRTIYSLCSLIDYNAVQVQLATAYVVVEHTEQDHGAGSAMLSVSRSFIAYFRQMKIILLRSMSLSVSSSPATARENVSTLSGYAASASGMKGGPGDRALDILRKMRSKRETSSIGATLSLIANLIFSFWPSPARSAKSFVLSPREVMDAVNATEALSLIAVKALSEDSSGRAYHFLPCTLSSLLSLSVALRTYEEALLDTSSSRFVKLKQPQISKWTATVLRDETKMLQLAVEEAVKRICKSNAQVLKTCVFPKRLAMELQRISSS